MFKYVDNSLFIQLNLKKLLILQNAKNYTILYTYHT